MTSSISLPTIILFENHMDTTAKKLVKYLLPKLAKEGYKILCLELPQDMTSNEIINEHKKGLEFDLDLHKTALQYLAGGKVIIKGNLSDMYFEDLAELMRMHVSSKKYMFTAERLKNLPSSILSHDLYSDAVKHSMNVKGIDIDQKARGEIMKIDVSHRMEQVEKNEELRINAMADNLAKLHAEQNGAIYICGSIHADNLIAKLKEKNMEDDVIYGYIHSSNRHFKEDADEIKIAYEQITLRDRFHFLKNEDEIAAFAQKMLEEIKQKTLGEIDRGNLELDCII